MNFLKGLNMNWKRLVYSLLISLLVLSVPLGAQVDLRYENNETPTWQEAISMYQRLDEQYEDASLLEVGWTDAGKPLHLFIIDRGRQFSPS